MKPILVGAILALCATPAIAQQAPVAERSGAAVRERMASVPGGSGSDRQDYAEALRNAYKRAHNAVENGASPERVRAKLQQYKHQLRRQWNADH